MSRSPQRNTTQQNKYITRFDYAHTHGWQVRVPKNFQKDPVGYHSKLFSDQKHNGKNKARNAAIAYRDNYLLETRQQYLLSGSSPRSSTRIRDSKNTSGIIGVRLAMDERELLSGVSITPTWVAYGMVDGRSWRKSFSVHKYGVKEAFIKACVVRFTRHGPLSVVGDMRIFPCRLPVDYKKTSKSS